MAFVKLDKAESNPGEFVKASWGDQVADNFAALTGEVKMFPGASVPTGWLDCDGASYLRADYADLFAVIGTTWGAADGTHFNVPDLRSRCPIGVGTGSGLTARALAATGGAETHQLSVAEMPSHYHSEKIIGGSAIAGNVNPTYAATNTAANTSSTGGDTAHNNMQPWAALYFIIKT